MKGFLEYVPGNSLIHRLDPRTKLLLAFMICVGCFSCSNIYVLLGFLAFDVLIGAVGHIFGQTMRLLKGLIKISVFLFVLQVLFIQHGNALVTLPLGILLTDDGLIIATQVVLRLIGATLPLAIMITLTQLSDLSTTLVSKCYIPYKYAFAVTSAIRFIPTFSRDMQDIMEAQTARGVEFDTKNIFKKLKLVFPLCVPLLISSVQKIDSAAIAAELRGFNLRTKDSSYRTTKFGALDILAFAVGIGIIALGVIF